MNLSTPYFVYVDWTNDNYPRPFYVGKGTIYRIRFVHRNKRHAGISKKYGCSREILLATKDESFALEEEIRLIAQHKTNHSRQNEGHWGANFTDGGEGSSGLKHSQETKKKLSIVGHGRKLSDETKKRMAKSRLGKKHSRETRRKISEASTNQKRGKTSEETKQKISAANKKNA